MPIAEEVLLGVGVGEGMQDICETSPVMEPVQYGNEVVIFVVQEVNEGM